jgi:hypothetical protein
MPLLDHFRPPVDELIRRGSFHASWATRIADQLTPLVPTDFTVEESSHHAGGLEIDVASYDRKPGDRPEDDPWRSEWQPPQPDRTGPLAFSDQYEVKVFNLAGGRKLVAAIELVSPGNKDRASERLAFATKCANYLHNGIGLIVIDVVTERKANLHNETMRLMQAESGLEMTATPDLYAVSYRPVVRGERTELEVWLKTFRVGDPLPSLPLRLVGDYFIQVDFEAAYTETCRRRRLIP